MCLIVFSYRQHPKYELILAANRDENYKRPTRQARFWDDHPNILAGKDLQAGGTWMGINKAGFFSALTNFRDPSIQRDNPPSRGHLVLDYLKNPQPPHEYLSSLAERADKYMGFNLLAGNIHQLGYYSNQERDIQLLDPGLYGLSNHLLNTPWPKVERAKDRLNQLVDQQRISEDALFNLLADDRQAPDDKLPDTGIPKGIEKQVSPVFIKSENYGTRCSTLLLIDKSGEFTFTERRFEPGSMEIKEENRYEFIISQ